MIASVPVGIRSVPGDVVSYSGVLVSPVTGTRNSFGCGVSAGVPISWIGAFVFVCSTGARSGEAYYMTKDVRPELEAYYVEATIDFKKDGSFTLKKN